MKLPKKPALMFLAVWAALPAPAVLSAAEKPAYINGGVGIEERMALPKDYPLKIVFATDAGRYLTNVEVTLIDKSGAVAADVKADNGPWLLLRLPKGTYKLEASHGGEKKTVASVSVPAKGTTTVLLTWPETSVDMGLKE